MSYHVLMEQTLPTIVGAGVVSRATDTMFGRGGSRRRTTTRKFDGKLYREANWHTTKAVADRDADYFRRRGHSARVVESYNARLKRWGYMVYVR